MASVSRSWVLVLTTALLFCAGRSNGDQPAWAMDNNELVFSKTDSLDDEFLLLLQRLQEFPTEGLGRADSLCSLQSTQAARFFKYDWARTMWDSKTKIPEGLLEGNIWSLGSFDECVGVQVADVSGHELRGQHCMATIMSRTTNVYIRPSFCIPATCTPKDLREALLSLVNKTVTDVTVNKYHCQTNKSVTLDAADWVVIVILAIFVILAILSTGYDLYLKSKSKAPADDILLAFSVYSNGKRLLSTKVSGETLGCVHGIRFLSMVWVVLGHRYMYAVALPVVNLKDMMNMYANWNECIIYNSTVSVDTFFLLSGMLLCYLFLKDVQKNNRFNIVFFYVYRYLRLTPAYAIMVAVTATWMVYIGSGPLWDWYLLSAKDNCLKYWWAQLLYVNNYVNPNEECVGQSWYLAVDMQLYWISPLILIPLWKWRKAGVAQIFLFVVIAITIPVALAAVYEFPNAASPRNPPTNEVKNNRYRLIYVPAYSRAGPYFVGMLLGYVLHEMKQRKIKLGTFWYIAGWLASCTLCLSTLFGFYPFAQPWKEYNVAEQSIYMGFHRTAWAFGIAWVIFACCNGKGGPVNTLLSWRAWQPLSRLTYCTYLMHITTLQYDAGTLRKPTYFTDYNVIRSFLADLMVTLVLAAIFSLIFESPIIIIEKRLLKRAPRPPRATSAPKAAEHPEVAIENGRSQEEKG